MRVELPGQLGGPECKPLMPALIKLRRLLNDELEHMAVPGLETLVLLLRVDGSIQQFGEAGAESPTPDGDRIVCEIVVPDHDWAVRSELEIRAILADFLKLGFERCSSDAGLPSGVNLAAQGILKRSG